LCFFQSFEDAAFGGIVQWVKHKPDQRGELFENLFLQIDISSLSGYFLNETVISQVSVEIRG